MPLLSVSKAAKVFYVSRPTLQKALKDGIITGEKLMSGGSESWQIDTAELARLYLLRDSDPVNISRQKDDIEQPLAMEKTGNNGALPGEAVKALEIELQAVRAELDMLRTDNAYVERELAASQAVAEERRRILDDMMKLLPKPEDQPRGRGLWSRLFGIR